MDIRIPRLGTGVVLTGMGNQGVMAIKASGGYVFDQDEATSFIFGMPSVAVKTGAVDKALGIDAIAAAIDRRAYLFQRNQAGVV